MKINVNTARPDEIARVQDAFRNAALAVGAQTDDGLLPKVTQATLQMERFVAGHIEVDTGRTKNSVFPTIRTDGNGVTGMLSSNVSYAPHVRDGGHNRQFFEYARDVEGPRVLDWLGGEVTISLGGAFNGN